MGLTQEQVQDIDDMIGVFLHRKRWRKYVIREKGWDPVELLEKAKTLPWDKAKQILLDASIMAILASVNENKKREERLMRHYIKAHQN